MICRMCKTTEANGLDYDHTRNICMGCAKDAFGSRSGLMKAWHEYEDPNPLPSRTEQAMGKFTGRRVAINPLLLEGLEAQDSSWNFHLGAEPWYTGVRVIPHPDEDDHPLVIVVGTDNRGNVAVGQFSPENLRIDEFGVSAQGNQPKVTAGIVKR